MSRIRSIKPDFWTSEQVVSCSPNARLLFIGLWNFCDDHGIHPASYVRIKAEVFPADNFAIAEIKNWINELIKNELIREYIIDAKAYWIVSGWKAHQRIDKPTYRHPLPHSNINNSVSTRRELDESSLTTPQPIDEPSATEWKGVEGSGKEVNICEVETSPVRDSDAPSTSASTQELFKYWQETMNHPKAKLDKKRKGVIQKALKLGFSIDELKQAISGCLRTPYNMGQNDSGQVYDDISLILRDAEHIERFMNNDSSMAHGAKNTDDLMAGVI